MTEQAILVVSLSVGWHKSTYSGNEGGGCVEVLDGYQAGVPVRDSKASNGPALVFSAVGWAAFVVAVKAGDLRS
ncbi:DUF397 domain-containing protein [Streptomyces sp. ID05-47C]|uniref:DUF397 domain-containing protein n=1 Tax=Streptomyces sp. ID05-47C TaxID=3028665 RepID=UPI0029A7F18F|nr:DUF397 domain-containing protein [Streptomyces sp. ID05-47C]MDX3572808.1 DUF397 domain-containing protein [Streptomyces sp. ID05-47C]